MDHDPRLALAMRTVMAVLLFLVAAFLFALAFGFHSPGPGEVRTPAWVVGLGSLVFAIAGLAVLFQDRPAVGWLAAMVMLACGAAAGLWIGLWAEPDHIQGGVPLASQGINVLLGRIAFAAGGVICLGLLAWGLWLGPRRQRE